MLILNDWKKHGSAMQFKLANIMFKCVNKAVW